MKVRRRVPALDMIKSENVKVKVSRRVPALDIVKREKVKVRARSRRVLEGCEFMMNCFLVIF